MDFLSILCVLLLVKNLTNAETMCKKINKYENGLPSGLKNISQSDFVGEAFTAFNKLYVNNLGKVQKFGEKCETLGFYFGRFPLRMSPVPIGCCSVCCLIDKMENYVQFHFTNKKYNGTMKKVSLSLKRGKLRQIGFNNKLQTIIYIHGFSEHKVGLSNLLITEAYLSRKEDYNILLAGWSDLASLPWYTVAVDNAKLVAEAISKFILFYHKTKEMPIENIHLIGVSLGAHISGDIGKIVGRVKRIPRITGLDPAFPLISLTDKTQRLSEDDADYVDIIHTDMGNFGFPISLGHADFYPNLDKNSQPRCDYINQIEEFILCDHVHSVELYAESVKNPHLFPAVKIESMNTTDAARSARFAKGAFMGFGASKSSNGDFYLSTSDQVPYGTTLQE